MSEIFSSVSYLNCRSFYDRVLALLFILMPFAVTAQVKSKGLPLINNFSRTTYKASTQNWDIAQNKLGFVYFANNDGLLEFDGQHWNVYAVPNKSIVRSIRAIGDTIFVGAFEEFGFFSPNTSGMLVYTSLVSLVPQEFRSFDEIWKIHSTDQGIIFQSFKHLFIYNGSSIKVSSPFGTFGHSYQVGKTFYYVDLPSGLYNFAEGEQLMLIKHPLLQSNELRCILPFEKGKVLVGFINEGLFIFDGDKLTPWNTDVNNAIMHSSIFSARQLSNGDYAFGTIQNGLYIADAQGRVLQHLNRFKGLQNNTVLSMFEDRSGNLWLGLDNGIDYIEINSPLSIFDHTFHIESTYSSVVYEGRLYVGTNQGLFVAPMNQLDKNGEMQDNFEFIEGTDGQVWKLEVVDNTLLCGHNFGLFQVKGNRAVKITSERGYWSFLSLDPQSDTLLCGTYNGLSVIVNDNGNWRYSHRLEGFNESSRNIAKGIGKYDLWMAHGYRGIFHLRLNSRLTKVEKHSLFGTESGLPKVLPYNVFTIGNETIFTSSKGLFTFQASSNTFVPHEKLNKILGENVDIDQLSADINDNIWYFSNGTMGLLRLLEDGSFSNVTAPFMRINNSLIESYENVFVYDNRNVFIGTKNGLLHYDPFYRKDYSIHQKLVFREISFAGKDSIIALGGIKNKDQGESVKGMKVPFSFNNAVFRFSNPEFEGAGSCLFSFRLEGLDETWSAWSPLTFKEYMNLPEGQYTFSLRSKSLNNSEEKMARFSFVIQPPFYRSLLAYILYLMAIISFVIGNVFFIQRRVSLAKQQEEEKHLKAFREQELTYREQALLAEKEIINLKNESLQSEVIHKNKELANTTLHLIHKNKILNAIKAQLNGLLESNMAQAKKNQIDSLIYKINRELKNEKFQEVFDDYFDDVHQDFISRLKDRHSNLSPRELRLCAYLKMNLSTKEIAPLMNISIRGVEIGRYRLRKKLELERDDNLIDYLLKF